MSGELDLEISNNDLAFAASGEPVFITGAAVVAQDIAHRLRESGLPPLLVGEESSQARRDTLARIRAAVESDRRIQPGTSKSIESDSGGSVTITAETLEGATVSTQVAG